MEQMFDKKTQQHVDSLLEVRSKLQKAIDDIDAELTKANEFDPDYAHFDTNLHELNKNILQMIKDRNANSIALNGIDLELTKETTK